MEAAKKIIAYRVSRFVIIGICNTLVNFAVLNFSFYVLHQSKLISSFIATSVAVIFSFILNRNFVFVDKDRVAKKLARFIVVTVSGILLIQNSVYALSLKLLSNHELGIINIAHTVFGIQLSNNFVDVNLSNVIASAVVMFWNYNTYRTLVFNGERRRDDIVETP